MLEGAVRGEVLAKCGRSFWQSFRTCICWDVHRKTWRTFRIFYTFSSCFGGGEGEEESEVKRGGCFICK